MPFKLALSDFTLNLDVDRSGYCCTGLVCLSVFHSVKMMSKFTEIILQGNNKDLIYGWESKAKKCLTTSHTRLMFNLAS